MLKLELKDAPCSIEGCMQVCVVEKLVPVDELENCSFIRYFYFCKRHAEALERAFIPLTTLYTDKYCHRCTTKVIATYKYNDKYVCEGHYEYLTKKRFTEGFDSLVRQLKQQISDLEKNIRFLEHDRQRTMTHVSSIEKDNAEYRALMYELQERIRVSILTTKVGK